MKLVEVIETVDTAPAVITALMEVGRRMGRIPVRAKDWPGFLVNFGGRAFTLEALHILHEGAARADQIDAVMRECCGFRMGPFELMDLTGIDVNFPVSRIIYEGYQDDPRLRTTPAHESLYLAGRLGRKTGVGFYAYDAMGKRIDTPDEIVNGEAPRAVAVADWSSDLQAFCRETDMPIQLDDGTMPLLVAPLGEDSTTIAHRLGLDYRRVVAVDLVADTSKRVTLMSPPGADPSFRTSVASWLARTGRTPTVIQDSPGFIAQRILAMIANLGCEMAQIGLAAPADIDTALKLGLNYPAGPLELADRLGVDTVMRILEGLQGITGCDRYRPSLWLRRRALLGLSATATA